MARNVSRWWAEKKLGYQRSPDNEESEDFLSDDERLSIGNGAHKSSHSHLTWPLMVVMIFFTAITSTALGVWVDRTILLNSDKFALKHTSQYSPVISDVDVTYSVVQFNGSLLKSNVFRQDAGPEVDAAWKSLGADFHAARVPVDLATKSGLAPDQVKVSEKYGGGYPAHVEGLHHLHCLNLLRKSLAWNFSYYKTQGLGPFSNDESILKYHITHCLDILRQQLMCTVDVGVLGQVWYQPPNKPLQAFVDFNTKHTCRNFEAIRDWAEQHQLPDAPPEDFLELPKEGDRIYYTVP